ncbi:MAG TPA: PQQ-dependent sugar dehydrogenase, partial [Pyrinomonadaceae bacterium]|nr:PQQ-dependent sugar dehydrogenase [Pyrinomonadaceae bacterium]
MSSNVSGATAARSVRLLSFAFLLLVAIGELGSRAAFAQSDLPPSFEDSLVTNIASPTAVAFTPDGRLLVTTQPGQLFVVQGGTLLAAPALDLSARLCSNIERGLLGVAVDPQFKTNRYIYVYYTFNKFGVCETNTSRSPVNRVSRFTLRDNNTVVSADEKILIDNIHSPNGNHNAGDLHFGKDGYLYITVGDGGRDYAGDSGQAGQNDAARDEFVLLGKILRITRDGDIPPTNPFRGADSARCNTTGRTDPGKKCQETFAWGLRNPFRFAFDPNAAGTRFFINDVGQNTWEEINLGTAGADYGWNVREGHCAKASSSNCGAPPTGMTNPIFDYNHSTGCASITGGAFVPNGAWSIDFDAAYLYSDYVCGKIFKLTPNGGGGYTNSVFATGLGGSSAVAMTFGPGDDGKQALYYTTYAGGGQVRRISYTGAANRPPVARASANPTSGSSAPLQVSFNASASSDPDGDALKYEWDFGDATAKSTAANPVHTYQATGTFTAVLRVTDARGSSGTASVKITVGNSPPQPVILAPAATARFSVGQTITLQGWATDEQDGTLPDAKLTWQVLLHHNTHTHPLLNPTPGNNIVITAPAPEDLAATETSYLEIRLTATDSGGLTRTITQDLRPRLVNVTFNTQPANLKLEVNGTTSTAPRTLVSWEKYLL